MFRVYIPLNRRTPDVLESLDWQIHPSRFSQLRNVFLRINFDAISLSPCVLMWHRMLSVLDHVSMSQIKSLEIAIMTRHAHPPPSLEPVAQTLRSLDWIRLDQILRRYGHLSGFPCIRVWDEDDELPNVRRYLEIIFFRLPLCRNEGRVQLEWFSETTFTPRSYIGMGPIGGLLLPSKSTLLCIALIQRLTLFQ